MRIGRLRSECDGVRARVTAEVVWEDRDRPPMDVFFETEARFADDLSSDPHAFLVGCMPPALHHGERRIAIDDDICAEFADGLRTAIALLRGWTRATTDPIELEPRSTDRLPRRHSEARAAAFLSGGVDSLANLRVNRLTYPAEHPRSIRDGLIVHGFDIGVRDEENAFELATASLVDVADAAGVTLIPVKTNLRQLDPNNSFWMREWHGAALAAVAHAFSNRLSSASIASTSDAAHLPPLWGSHPMLDPNYGSAELRIHHDGLAFARLDKVRIVSDWDVALQRVRVCTGRGHPGTLNCGRCEKCIRTMLALLALGALPRCGAFAANDVPVSALLGIAIHSDYNLLCYRELIQPLEAVGRSDLAKKIDRRTRRYTSWESKRGWRGLVSRVGGDKAPRAVHAARTIDETRDWGRVIRRIRARGFFDTSRG